MSAQASQATADDGRKMTTIRSEINKMTRAQLVQQCQKFSLNSQGNRDALSRRLKNFYKRQRLLAANKRCGHQPNSPDKYYDYLCVVDFECTCEDGLYDFEHEIIEFPVVVIKTAPLEIVDEFHAFVKPLMRPKISEFCTKLTAVTQADVDAALPFLDVLVQFRAWMEEKQLGTMQRYAFVTDGPWDMGKFFQMQCLFSGLDKVPHEFRYWINIRRAFAQWHTKGGRIGPSREWKNLAGMLKSLNFEFEGREHCGRDDARNIARIALHLLKQGFELRINERLMRRDLADKCLDARKLEAEERQKVAEQKRIEYEQRMLRRYGALPQQINKMNVGDKEPDKQEPKERTADDIAIQLWREHLPYKVVSVSKNEFLLDAYEECQTCDEAAESDHES